MGSFGTADERLAATGRRVHGRNVYGGDVMAAYGRILIQMYKYVTTLTCDEYVVTLTCDKHVATLTYG